MVVAGALVADPFINKKEIKTKKEKHGEIQNANKKRTEKGLTEKAG